MAVRPPPIARPPRTPVWGVMETLVVLNPSNAKGQSRYAQTSFTHGNSRWFGGFVTPWFVVKGRYIRKPRGCGGPSVAYALIKNATGGDSFRVDAEGDVVIRVLFETDAPHGHPKKTGSTPIKLNKFTSIPTHFGQFKITNATVSIDVQPDPRTGRYKCEDGITAIRATGRRQKTPYPNS